MVLRWRFAIGLLAFVIVALAVVVVRQAAVGPAGGSGGGAGASPRPPGVPGDAERAVVTDHVDGDTLRLWGSAGSALLGAEETTVRLLEIDTPESVAPGSPVECYAERAGAALAELVPVGSQVWVAADVELLDPYGRVLLYLWDQGGLFVNLEMVETGHARAVLYEPNDEHIDLMRRAERRARSAGVGLWGSCDYFGEPRGLLDGTGPTTTATEPSPGVDPRYSTCVEAIAAGLGDYRRGRDEEYAWYDDSDGDGRVCER